MEEELVCVLCGAPWIPKIKNRCDYGDCKGFCSWGYEKDGPMLSWNPDGSPKRPPKE